MAKKFCGAYSLKTGAITIGFLEFILYLAGLIFVLVHIPPKEPSKEYVKDLKNMTWINELTRSACFSAKEVQIKKMMLMILDPDQTITSIESCYYREKLASLRLGLILLSCLLCFNMIACPLTLIIGAVKENIFAIMTCIGYKFIQFFEMLICLIFAGVTNTFIYAIVPFDRPLFKFYFIFFLACWQYKYLDIVGSYLLELSGKVAEVEKLQKKQKSKEKSKEPIECISAKFNTKF